MEIVPEADTANGSYMYWVNKIFRMGDEKWIE